MPKPATNPLFQADYSKMMDPFRMATAFKMSGFDFGALMEMQRKNVEVITATYQATFENLQAFAQRHAELMHEGFEKATGLAGSVKLAPAPQEKIVRQAENIKTVAQKYTANVRDTSETRAKGNGLSP
jgi:hypothetical protein